MILAITAVNDHFINECLNQLHRFDNGRWDIHIQTDKPNLFSKYNVYEYDNKVFSYYDKQLFPLKLSAKHKEPVVLLDADDLHKPTDVFIKYFSDREKSFLYPRRWPHCEDKTYGHALKDKINYPHSYDRLKYAIEYWIKNGVNYKELIPIWEWIVYIPYLEDKIDDIIKDIELMKPLVECGTILSEKSYSENNIGCAEGLILSYALEKNNVKFKEFKSVYLSLW